MGIDSYYDWQDRKTRPRETVVKPTAFHVERLELTQPITVKESDLSDTAVVRVRKAMLDKNRG